MIGGKFRPRDQGPKQIADGDFQLILVTLQLLDAPRQFLGIRFPDESSGKNPSNPFLGRGQLCELAHGASSARGKESRKSFAVSHKHRLLNRRGDGTRQDIGKVLDEIVLQLAVSRIPPGGNGRGSAERDPDPG